MPCRGNEGVGVGGVDPKSAVDPFVYVTVNAYCITDGGARILNHANLLLRQIYVDSASSSKAFLRRSSN